MRIVCPIFHKTLTNQKRKRKKILKKRKSFQNQEMTALMVWILTKCKQWTLIIICPILTTLTLINFKILSMLTKVTTTNKGIFKTNNSTINSLNSWVMWISNKFIRTRLIFMALTDSTITNRIPWMVTTMDILINKTQIFKVTMHQTIKVTISFTRATHLFNITKNNNSRMIIREDRLIQLWSIILISSITAKINLISKIIKNTMLRLKTSCSLIWMDSLIDRYPQTIIICTRNRRTISNRWVTGMMTNRQSKTKKRKRTTIRRRIKSIRWKNNSNNLFRNNV